MEFGKEYIKDFDNNIEYSEFIVSSGYIEPNVSHIELGNMIHYNKDEHDYSKNYLTFIPLEEGNFTLTIGSAVTTTMLQSVSYSIDGGQTWTTTNNVDDTTITITTPYVNTDDTVMWKGQGIQMASGFSGSSDEQLAPTTSRFGSSGRFNVQGNIMSLLNGDDFENSGFASGTEYNFLMLFGRYLIYNQVKVVSAKNLVIERTNNKSHEYLFFYCNTLIEPPKRLPSELSERCYMGMFYCCTSLAAVPKDCLPSTELAESCYCNMFYGCESLTSVPDLPATALTNYCYDNMFRKCKNLTSVPKDYLPALETKPYCYRSMFYDCVSLKNAPDLPSTVLTERCYSWMFDSCRSLTTPPELPATTLAEGCYRYMFSGCTNLETAPELPAAILTPNSCPYMFANCSKINKIVCLATDISASSCLTGWVSNVSPTGVFIKAAGMSDWTTGVNGIPSGWVVKTDQDDKYLTFVATESGTFKFNGDSMDYSLDGGNTWTSLASNTDTPTVSAGNKIMWKATLTPRWGGKGKFSSTGNFTVEGNPMSLLFGDNFIGQTSLSGKDYAFYGLFNSCTGMTSAENLSLPATTLATSCYDQMFIGCTNLTTAPQLPATTLVNFCYEYMFYGCTSLTTAPQLPATTLANYCYNGMFESCTSLTKAPQLPATTLANNCYYGMFRDCTSLNSITCLATDISASSCTSSWVDGVAASGTFTKAASMSNWTTGIDGIPNGWSVVNAS